MILSQKNKILQAAWMLFRENGIKATSVESICKELKISKKTFYNHFKNKEDLITQTFQINKGKIYKLIERTNEQNLSPFITLVQLIKYFRRMLHSKSFNLNEELFFPISPMIVDEIGTVYPNIWEEIDRFRYEIILKLASLLEEQKESFLREDVNPKVFTAMLLSAITNIIQPDFLRNNLIPIDEAVDSVITILFNGMIRADKQEEVKSIIYEGLT